MTQQSEYAVAVKSGALDAVVVVPGSKSIAHRALICAALARGDSTITGLPDGDDTQAMLQGLMMLGATISLDGADAHIEGSIDLDRTDAITVDANLAGTTARFLTAVGALRGGSITVTGNESLRSRPMKDLHLALEQLGADVSWQNEKYCLPVTVQRGKSYSHSVQVAADTSSQFVTSLMLIAPILLNGLTIELTGDIISLPYIAMSASVMKSFGAHVRITDNRIIVIDGGGYVGCRFAVEPDASSASYPFAAAAVVGGRVRVDGMRSNMMQGDRRFIDVLRQMGCEVSEDQAGITVGRDANKPLQGVDIDMSEISDLVPTLAIVAMFAKTPTRIRNVGFIRNKESDRIGDLASELRSLGAKVVEHEDGLEISPQALHGGSCDTHHDHRIAMAFGIAGLKVPGVIIGQANVVSKSWPQFWEMLEAL
ncbi:MAG: 3-phosphoshikimate 1-carboxyvinyltransferase [Ilumatobacteraceae bacterium]|nr:3-phosphoshikimate 1-carboxyvinyltransferase [Ilumatobacteraceae bacterium]